MSRPRKKELAHRLFQDNIQLFQCPICQGEFVPTENFVMRCRSNHSFDLARSGYLNLLPAQAGTGYDKQLFMARRRIFAGGVYEPLITKIGGIIAQLPPGVLRILDAGCGEGSLLAGLSEMLQNVVLLGIDISRDGIRLAGAFNRPIMWCVADLARLPLRGGSADVILNVLSPANYEEFKRVLKPEGLVVKVLPGERYLQEIRTRLAGISEYSNRAVLANLELNLRILGRERLSYEVPITAELWPDLVQMTPLTQHRRVMGTPPGSVSIDLEIIQGSLKL